MEILLDNKLHSVCYLYVLLIIGELSIHFFSEQFGFICFTMIIRVSFIVICGLMANIIIYFAIFLGYGEKNGNWCTHEVVASFLMLYYHTRDRARIVLERMKHDGRIDDLNKED